MNEQAQNKRFPAWIVWVALALVALLGVGLMIYPPLAAKYNEMTRSEIMSQYQEEVKQADTTMIDTLWSAAEEYNRKYFAGELNPLTPEENGYFQQLKLEHISVMAYISIPKIDVRLPVYHDVMEGSLQKGAGHMPQSSLPVGGENTRTVITAHSGMADNRMFSDLDKLEAGDIFTIETLGETLTYQVFAKETVLPTDVKSLQIESGKDLATLITCTPFGVNTHRLLVHGMRIETPNDAGEKAPVEENTTQPTEADVDSTWEENYQSSVKMAVLIAACPVAGLILFLTVRGIIKKRGREDSRE